MSLEYIINGIKISSADVLDIPKTEEAVVFGDQKLLASSLELKLDNIDDTYDDRVEGSLFYAMNWYHKELEIYDTDLRDYIWVGLITNIEINDGSKVTTVKTTNSIGELSKKACICNYTGISPAEAIKNIILNIALIPQSYLIADGFTAAKSFQENNNMTVDINLTAEHNKTCIDVINELHRISLFYLYSHNNKIAGWQWQEWDGTPGLQITEGNLVAGKFRQWFDDKAIKNHYNIAYDAGTVVSYATAELVESINQYGKRSFVVPANKNDSTAASDFPILYDNGTGATFFGNLVLSRWGYIKKFAEFELDDEMTPVLLNTQVDLDFGHFVMEPLLVTSRNHSAKTRRVSITGEFLNTPHQYYARSTERPLPVELVSVVQDGPSSVMLKWSNSDEATGYRLNFSTVQKSWRQEISQQGVSPVSVLNPIETVDGYLAYRLASLQRDVTLHFMVRVYNDWFIESENSNILSIALSSEGWEYENKYRITGNLFIALTIDVLNPFGKYTPTEYITYDSQNYDSFNYQPAGIYISRLFHKSSATIKLHGKITRATNSVHFMYRSYVGGVFGSWQYMGEVEGHTDITLPGDDKWQFKLVYDIGLYSDTDSVTVKEII